MVREGLADGMVSGAAHSTAATVRPAFEVIRTRPDASIVSSVFFMCLADRVLVYGDCAVNPDPDAEQLADIAVQSATTAARFGVEPRIAMLSYSTGTSGSGADVDKVREATELVRQRRPDLLVEGPIQYDAAVEPSVAATKLPDSEVAGRATVLIFPDLNTGNNTYKAVQRSAGAVAVGPGPPGPAQAGERPVARRPGLRHHQHGRHHGHPGAAAERKHRVRAGRRFGRKSPPVTATRVLVLNSGSSSVKYQLLDMADGSRLAVGLAERIGERQSRLVTPLTSEGERRERIEQFADHEAALRAVAEELDADGLGLDSPELAAIGHRVVHGGQSFTRPTLIDDAVRRGDRAAGAAGPAAQPGQPDGHRHGPGAATRDLPQVAVFDTSLPHRRCRSTPPATPSRRRPPTSTAYAATDSTAPRTPTSPARPPNCSARTPRSVNVIVLHLGNGASASAVQGGRCVDTSMGLTPLEGLVMGTRSGDVDPAVVFHLVRVGGMTDRRDRRAAQQASGLARSVRRQRHAGDPPPDRRGRRERPTRLRHLHPPAEEVHRRLLRGARPGGRRGVHRRGRARTPLRCARPRVAGPGGAGAGRGRRSQRRTQRPSRG